MLATAAKVKNADVPISAHAILEDVDQKFTFGYKIGIGCPSSYVKIRDNDFGNNDTGKVPFRDISIDGKRCKCEGSHHMSIVPAKIVKKESLMKKSGFIKMYRALKKNKPAMVTLKENHSNAKLLVGHINGDMKCGNYSQDKSAVWFFIRESSDFSVILPEKNSSWVRLTVPKRSRGLMMMSDEKMCMLIDLHSSKNKTIVREPYNPSLNTSVIPSSTKSS